GVIGSPVSGLIMHTMHDVLGLQSWRWLFLIEGLPPLVLMFFVARMLHDTPASAPWLTADELAIIERDLRADRESTRHTEHKSFAAALRSPRFYLLTGMGVALLAGTANVFFWLPTIIRRTGVTDLWTLGMLSALPYVAGFVCQYLMARHSDAHKERRWHAAAMGPFWAMPSLYLSRQAAAGGIALISTLAGLGSLVSPGIVGWLNETTHSMAAGQYYLAALMLIGAITVVAVGPHDASSQRR
ncbi:MAG: MFS transporter, partial [Burkholderia sp.]|nr:MFS transporter [Burkholderia sp.]